MNLNIDLKWEQVKNIPPVFIGLASLLPVMVFSVYYGLVWYLPKTVEIKNIETDISRLQKNIQILNKKVALFSDLPEQYNAVKAQLFTLEQQLPQQNEVANILRELEVLAKSQRITALLWYPQPKKVHSSGMLYEVVVKVKLSGSYHKLGVFFSELIKLQKIIHVRDVEFNYQSALRKRALLDISFSLVTYSPIDQDKQRFYGDVVHLATIDLPALTDDFSVYQYFGKKDPFLKTKFVGQYQKKKAVKKIYKKPTKLSQSKKQTVKRKKRPLLERFDLDKFSLVGVSFDGDQRYAYLKLSGRQKTFRLNMGMKLGNRKGSIIEINENKILVQEYLETIQGSLFPIISVINIAPLDKV
jgi:type IV pilus assembly protein PilO